LVLRRASLLACETSIPVLLGPMISCAGAIA